MNLYLLRHADAVARAASDSARELTEKGVSQAQRVGKFCRRNELRPEVILTSPYVRALQTAQLAATELGAVEVVTAKFLSSGMKPENAIEELKAYARFSSVMIVGHEPDFSLFAAHLLGAPRADAVRLRKASLTLFEIEDLRPASAVLQFSIPVKLM